MSKSWTPEELKLASEAMKAAGHPSYEEFLEAYNLKEETKMEGIAQEDLILFETVSGRCKLMQKYGDSKTAFIGHNVAGELVVVSISYESIVVATYQTNRWIRKDWYDASGDYECETYNGKWE